MPLEKRDENFFFFISIGPVSIVVNPLRLIYPLPKSLSKFDRVPSAYGAS
jgi:hypothetical protein